MRAYLASYRFGPSAGEFAAFVGAARSAVVVAAAADVWPARARAGAVDSELRSLREIGLQATELDLRPHVSPHHRGPDAVLLRALDAADLVWVRGGNTYVLQAQLVRSGAGAAIDERVRAGALAYAGYSAGACIAGPTTIGLDASDDPREVAELDEVGAPESPSGTPGSEGLSLAPFCVVPHARDASGEQSLLGTAEQVADTVAAIERAGFTALELGDDAAAVTDGDGRWRHVTPVTRTPIDVSASRTGAGPGQPPAPGRSS
ncbi:peptidase [Rhodococcus rhodnii]|uniref:Peptidase n=1 Tax=Rhodococcus rhodnii TaxID=38312 RepID=A0A6P2CJ60_9NOCA|nr:peptidase [Rhodococcus rhodnii]